MGRREDLQKLAQEASKILKNSYHVKRVFLIGSLAKGHVHERSDIDIVVEGLEPQLYIKALTQIYDALPPGVELNLIPFEDAYDSLKRKTLREGLRIYG